MDTFSTNQVAKKLGIGKTTFKPLHSSGKVAAPPETMAGGMRMRLWSESDIEGLRKALPKIANGRKTRYQKLRDKQKGSPQARPAPPQKKKPNHPQRTGQKPKAKSQKPIANLTGSARCCQHRTRPNQIA